MAHLFKNSLHIKTKVPCITVSYVLYNARPFPDVATDARECFYYIVYNFRMYKYTPLFVELRMLCTQIICVYKKMDNFTV